MIYECPLYLWWFGLENLRHLKKSASKVNPWDGKGLGKESVRKQLETSLANLRVKKVQICYLHAPGEFSLLIPTVAIDMF